VSIYIESFGYCLISEQTVDE